MPLAQARSTPPDVVAEIPDKGDCPAMARAIRHLHEIRKRENFPAADFAKVVLKDPGLSSKVLRVVNSAFFGLRGDPVTTISRAVVLLGIDTVVEIANGILLVEQFDRGDPALHESLTQSLRAALLAQALADRAGLANAEEAYLLGLFSNLGRLWLSSHYREELARAVEAHAADSTSLEEVIERHFGFTPDLLSAHIIDRWGLPPRYATFFRRHQAKGREPASEDKLLLVADIATEASPDEVVRQACDRLKFSEEVARQVLARVDTALEELSSALGIQAPARPPVGGASSRPGSRASKIRSAPSAEAPVDLRRADPCFAMEAAAEIARGIVDQVALRPLLDQVLAGALRSGGFDAVVLYVADAKQGSLIARFCQGEGVSTRLAELSTPLSERDGVPAATLVEGKPRLVAAASPSDLVPAGRTPPEIPAESIATYPVAIREQNVGVILATRGGPPLLDDSALQVLRLFGQLAALAWSEQPPTED